MTAATPTSRAPRTPFRRQPVLLLLLVLALLVVLTAVAVVQADTLSDSTQQALLAALDDEREARATYARAAEVFDAGPFAHVVEAERHHEAHLLDLFRAHGLDVPADAWAQRTVELPETATAACAAAVEWETANAAMYDGFLAREDLPADVRAVFQRLGSVSRERHLPAFQRCADGQLGGRMGGHGAHAEGRNRGCRMHAGGGHRRGGEGSAARSESPGRPGSGGCDCSRGGDCPRKAAAGEEPADGPAGSTPADEAPSGGAPGVAPDCLDADAPASGTFCPLPLG